MSNLSNPQFGEQFGISPKEERDMHVRAVGDQIHETLEKALFGEVGGLRASYQAAALHRMRGIPADMMKEDEHGHHASYTAGNWTTKWWGGKYAEHSHPKHGTVDATDMAISHDNGEEELPTNITGAHIKQIHHEFLGYKKENYPKDMQ